MGTALRINHVARGWYKKKTAACSRLKTDKARSGIPALGRSNKRTATVSTQRKQTYTQQQRLTQRGQWSGCATGRSCIFKCDVTWRRGWNPPPPDSSDWAESKTTHHHFTSFGEKKISNDSLLNFEYTENLKNKNKNVLKNQSVGDVLCWKNYHSWSLTDFRVLVKKVRTKTILFNSS